ncbi:MAG: hypothetical protein H0T89_18975 [Deltaproteobacteria bacterium]|nr:hypothetical protein [Deltaproteobacteria bacterium]
MATFNVFVVGPVDDLPLALQELAEAMGQRYGLPAADLVARLQRGRFRVKSNVDQATAEKFRRDLEAIGARVLIEDSTLSPTATPPAGVAQMSGSALPTSHNISIAIPASVLARTMTPQAVLPPRPTTPPSGLPTRSSTPPAGLPTRNTPVPAGALPAQSRTSTPPSALPPRTTTPPSGALPAMSRTTTPPSGLPPRPTPPPGNMRASHSGLPSATAEPAPRPSAPQFASGLAAAFAEQSPDADLGALGGDSAIGMSLASLDGEDSPSSSGQFDQPADEAGEQLPASIGPAPSRTLTPPPKSRVPASEPLDMFAPPDADEAAQLMDLHTDEVDDQARRRQSAPQVDPIPPTPASQQLRRTPTSMAAEPGPVLSMERADLPRPHVIAGAVLSVLVAFVPVHFVAGMRERSAFERIDREIMTTQAQADTLETHAALDGYRARQLENKEDARQSIALTSMLLWAVLAAGLAYLWFRRVPWNRFLKSPA